MNPIQFVYDKLKLIKTPAWLKAILGQLQELVWQITLDLGKEYISALKGKIIEVSSKPISSEDKFNEVWDFARNELKIIIKDRYLSLIIEALVNILKENRNI